MWVVYAICVAVVYGIRAVLFRVSARRGLDRNLLLLGAYIGAFALSVAGNAVLGQPWTGGAWIGAAMGAFAFVSNSAMYRGYGAGKASLIAILIGTSPIIVILLSYMLWGEKMNAGQGIAFLAVLGGVFFISYSNELSWRNMRGAGWGLLAMLFFGLTDILCKLSVIQGGQTLPTLIVMFGTGALLFLANWLGQARRTPRQAGGISLRRTLLWGMVVGTTNFAAMIFILPAFQLGVTGLVSVIISANILIVVIYARLVWKEALGRLEMFGIALIMAGITAIRLFS